jgi:Chitobiase/beta-hexosaminidase C-terminal domain
MISVTKGAPALSIRPAARGPIARGLLFLVLSALLSAYLAGTALAALSAVGPVDPSVGFPSYYQDTTGTRLQLCIKAGDPCLAGTTVAGFPSTPTNIQPETFYWVADADPGPLPGLPNSLIKLRLSLEAAFGAGVPQTGQQITFGRINIVGKGLTPNTTYTFTHPYGTATATTDNLGGLKFRDNIGCPAPTPGLPPCDFGIALSSNVGPFLKWDPAVAPAAPAGFLGDAVTAHPIVGSPLGTNFLRVASGGVTLAQTNNFIIAGKLWIAPVTVSPAGGVYGAPQTVTLTTADPAYSIRYTLDGTAPTATSPVYAGPITIAATATLSYAAVDPAGNQGATFSQTYTIDMAPPTVGASPAGGTYAGAQTVTLTAVDNVGPSTIYYTLDGTVPTTASARYTGPLALAGAVSLKYIGVDEVGNTSAVATQAYTINVAGPTTVSLSASAPTVDFGQSTALSGKLALLNGPGIGGQSVVLEQRPAGAAVFSLVANLTTSGDGSFVAAGVAPTRNTDYRVRFAGAAGGPDASASSLSNVGVRPLLSLSVSPTNAPVGSSITFSGAVNPATAAAKGGSVQFTIKRNGVVIQTSGTGVNTATGTYSWVFKPSQAGTYTVQASYTSPDKANYAGTAASPSASFSIVP